MALILISTLPLATAQFDPKLAYSETYPEFRPWESCYPIGDTYKPCFYNGHSVVLGSIYSCSIDSGTSVYFTNTASFSFTPPRKSDATLTFKMYECTYNPRTIKVGINGLCAIDVENRASGGMNLGLTTKSVTIDSSCLIEGENTITIDGNTELSLGAGACPSLSCMGAKLFADLTIPQESKDFFSSGSVSTDSVLSNYTFNIPIPTGAEGKFSLPTGAALLSCPECAMVGGSYKIGAGNHTVSYLIENLYMRVAYPNIYSAFLRNETPKVNITTSYAGSPLPSKIYFGNGTLACDAPFGVCELSLPEQGVGFFSLELQALESPIGRRGKAKIEYTIEPDPSVSFSETSDESSLIRAYMITNPTHLPFSQLITYPLPEDTEGNFSITPWPPGISSNSTSLSFTGSCPRYSNCTYRIAVRMKGVSVSISPPIFPASARVGDPLIGKGTISLTNTNQKRSMASRGLIPNCTSGCSWDLNLSPSETKALEYSLRTSGASGCGNEQFWGARPDEAILKVCVSVPENFPAETSIEYLVPWSLLQDYSKGLEARLGTFPIPATAGSSGALLLLGALPPGVHYITISYARLAQPPKDQNSETSKPPHPEIPPKGSDATAQGNQGPGEDEGAIGQATTPAGSRITIAAPAIAQKGEPVQVVIMSEDAPKEGEVTFVSPTGKRFSVNLVGGRATWVLDEVGTWKILFNGEEREIVVEGTEGANQALDGPGMGGTTGEPTRARSPDPTYPGISAGSPLLPQLGLELGPWVLLLVLLPLLAMPALGYFLIVASRSPQLSVSKTYDGKKVCLEIENRGGQLADIWITDALPDDAVLGDAGGGSFKKTIFGNVLKWRLPSLDSGEKWGVSYELRTAAGRLGEARALATDMRGAQVKAHSGGIELEKATAP